MKNITLKSNRKYLILFSMLLAGSFLFSACDGLGSNDPNQVAPTYAAQTLQALSQAQTLASYETLAAQMTQTAQATDIPKETATLTPTPTPTPTAILPTFTATPTRTPTQIRCNWVDYIKDVTIPDGTQIDPKAAFTKTWRLKNVGSCTWTEDYDLVFVSGRSFEASERIGLPEKVLPGETIDLSVLMAAPNESGSFTGYWMLADASGNRFGLGPDGNGSFWVKITVVVPTKVIYNFAEKYCAATWYSGAANPLPCPGQETDDATGYIVRKNTPIREDGGQENEMGLVTSPDNDGTDGRIVGIYPAFKVEKGDVFKTVIGCEYNSAGCSVIFELRYRIGDGPMQTLASWHEVYEGKIRSVSVDLSELAGENVKFVLQVRNYGTATNNQALWILPRILR